MTAVLFEKRGNVGLVTLNRPAKANAISDDLIDALGDAKAAALADGDLRALVVTGAGRHFCGGADLKSLSLDRLSPYPPRPRVGVEFDDIDLPVIAAINGAAMGGGCEIALTCDFRIIARDARIGLPEIKFGALPAAGGTVRLPRLIGPAAARRMIMLGEPLDAEAALDIGLVDEVVDGDKLLDRAFALAGQLSLLPLFALHTAKRLIADGEDLDLDTALIREREAILSMATPEEMKAARVEAAARSETYARIFAKGD